MLDMQLLFRYFKILAGKKLTHVCDIKCSDFNYLVSEDILFNQHGNLLRTLKMGKGMALD